MPDNDHHHDFSSDHDLGCDDHDLGCDDHDLGSDDHDLRLDDHDLRLDDHDLGFDVDDLGFDVDDLGFDVDDLGFDNDDFCSDNDDLGFDDDDFCSDNDDIGSDDLGFDDHDIGSDDLDDHIYEFDNLDLVNDFDDDRSRHPGEWRQLGLLEFGVDGLHFREQYGLWSSFRFPQQFRHGLFGVTGSGSLVVLQRHLQLDYFGQTGRGISQFQSCGQLCGWRTLFTDL